MTTDSKKIEHSLNDLIEIARDGDDFYTEAAAKVDNPELSSLFSQMAAHKREIVTGLGADVAATGGEPAERGTMVGSMHQLYSKVRAAFGDTDYAYVAELEESEDRLLDAFRDTIKDTGTPPAARAAAEKYLPRVVECHGIMRNRKLAMKDAG
ncbi:PA2169 family four-helix-bundle protein [Luteimonas arsenica]|uniref:PA2169 family four-helix-bundle protein n=1 Tax=Luteimonas arsenica TaxID=1586242 RepID=UPI001056A65E|nr:PA2169 family four-helix-bundle protein [Luteimonas arsenica]